MPPRLRRSIAVTRDKTTRCAAVRLWPERACRADLLINSRGQREWVEGANDSVRPGPQRPGAGAKCGPVEKAATGACRGQRLNRGTDRPSNGGRGVEVADRRNLSGSSPQYVRQKDGSPLKPVAGNCVQRATDTCGNLRPGLFHCMCLHSFAI